jgi:hypothetical protein
MTLNLKMCYKALHIVQGSQARVFRFQKLMIVCIVLSKECCVVSITAVKIKWKF